MLTAIIFICAMGVLGWLALVGLGEPRETSERLGLSLGIGAGIFSFTLFFTRLLGAPLSLPLIGAIYLILAGIAIIYARRTGRPIFSSTRIVSPAPFELILVCVIGLGFVVTFLVGLYWQPHFGDELTIWALKGKLIAANDSPSLAAHPYYPLNLPYQIASLELLGSDFVHGLIATYFISLTLVFFAHLREWTNRSVALFCTFVLSTTPFLIWQSTLAYANVPFAFYYVASTLALYRFLKHGETRALVLSGVLMGLAGWTRPEGLLYFAINLVVLALFSSRNRAAIKYAVGYTAIFVALWAPWTVYAQLLGYGGLFSTAAGGAREIIAGNVNVGRIGDIVSYGISRAVSLGDWGVVWLTLPLALVLGWRSIREHGALLTLIGLNILGIIYMYYSAGSDL